jgi:hypothetical protein
MRFNTGIRIAGKTAVAWYTGRSVEVDVYEGGDLVDHVSATADWQHYDTKEAMVAAAARSALNSPD